MEERIINAQEVGKKFINKVDHRWFIYNSPWKPEQIEIDYILVVEDNTKNKRGNVEKVNRGILGAILAGFVGVAIAAATSQPKWNVEIDIYLKDGRVVEISTQSEAMIKQLMKYARQPDPRARFRQQRGVL